MTACETCGRPSTSPLCGPCWKKELFHLGEAQALAAKRGANALRAGRPVIYVHGTAYEAPDIDIPADDAPEERDKSPFPWDLWDN